MNSISHTSSLYHLWRGISSTLFVAIATLTFATPTNVLLIAVDDLKPDLGCYGDHLAKTPNIDKLASQGMVFKSCYVQEATCAPSRASMLTGRRPDTTRVYDLVTPIRKALPDVISLPQAFKQHGYYTQAIGKVFHPGVDDPASWTAPTFSGPEIVGETNDTSGTIGGLPASDPLHHGRRGPSWYAPDLPDEAFHDGVIANKAIETLDQIKDRPFFLAVGFNRPHLPFVAPSRFFDKFKLSDFSLPDTQSTGIPKIAMHNSGELRQYRDIATSGPMSDQKSLQLIRAYYACASFSDAQIGKVLKELDRLKLRDNTIVILWGDHGWHLGDHGLWTKHTNFEQATHCPLIVSVPGEKTAGKSSSALVEPVDIYPTLMELCHYKPAPGLEGISLAPLLSSPDLSWKKGAISQFPRGKIMGYSLRTKRYRYTQWQGPKGKVVARELYDYQEDPMEKTNRASIPKYKGLIGELSHQLDAGWRGQLPAGQD